MLQLAVAFKLIKAARACWRTINAPTLWVGATFHHGKFVERLADNTTETWEVMVA